MAPDENASKTAKKKSNSKPNHPHPTEDTELVSHPAKMEWVTDGDTIDLKASLPFGVTTSLTVRLPYVDTHETDAGEDKNEKAEREKWTTIEWFLKGESEYDGEYPFTIETKPDYPKGYYGRYLAHIKRKSDGQYLHERLFGQYDGIKYGDDPWEKRSAYKEPLPVE